MPKEKGLCDQVADYLIHKDRMEENLKAVDCHIVTNSFVCADQIIADAIVKARCVVSEITYAAKNGIKSTQE